MAVGDVVVSFVELGAVAIFARSSTEFRIEGILIAKPINLLNEVSHDVLVVVVRRLVNHQLGWSFLDRER